MADQAEELRKMMAGQAVKHTPEPWKVGDGSRPLFAWAGNIIGNDQDGEYIIGTMNQNYPDKAEANARRIVAAVNACRGVSTADLEKYSEITKYVADVPTMIQQAGQALSEMTRERDEARAKVHDLEATMAGMLEIIQRIEADILALVKVR